MGGKASTESKVKWMQKAYHKYTVSLRFDTDGKLIDYLEEHKDKYGTTNIFRDALAEYIAREEQK